MGFCLTTGFLFSTFVVIFKYQNKYVHPAAKGLTRKHHQVTHWSLACDWCFPIFFKVFSHHLYWILPAEFTRVGYDWALAISTHGFSISLCTHLTYIRNYSYSCSVEIIFLYTLVCVFDSYILHNIL